MSFHHTARRGWAVEAMVRVGMAVQGKGYLGNKGAIYDTTFLVLLVFIPPLRFMIFPPYWTAGTKDCGGRVKLNIVTLLSTPIHITMDWVTYIFKALGV